MIHPTWLSVEPGSAAVLDCRLTCSNASVCNPLPTIRWQSESGYMNPEAILSQGRLTIPSALSEDEQYYRCLADNEHLSLSARTVIIVRKKCE